MCTSDGHVAAIVIVEALVVAAVSVVSTWSFMKRRYETANTNESVYSLPPDAIYPVSPTIGSFQSQGAGVTPSPNSEVYNMFPPPTIIVNNETRTNQEEFKRQVSDICISPVNERENSSAQSHAATEQPDEGIYESYDVHGPAAKPTSSPKDFNPSTLKQAIKNLKAKETADTRKYGSYEQYNQPPAKRPSIKPRPKKPNVPAPLPPPQIPSDAEVGDYEPTASETWKEPAEEETDYEFSFPPLPIKEIEKSESDEELEFPPPPAEIIDYETYQDNIEPQEVTDSFEDKEDESYPVYINIGAMNRTNLAEHPKRSPPPIMPKSNRMLP